MASYRRKGNSYEFRVCINGVKRSKSFTSITEGKRWAKLEEATLIKTKEAPRADYPTLKELSELFSLHILPNLRGASQEESRLRLLLRESFVNIPCNQITPVEIRDYIERLRQSGNSNSTVRLKLCLISSLYRFAKHELGLDIQSPTSSIKKPPVAPGRLRRLSGEEEKSLIQEAYRCANVYIAPAIIFTIETGLRRSELLNLDWSAYQPERKILEVRKTKNGHPRWLPLTPTAIDILERQLQLQTHKPFPITASTIENAWEHILKRAGINNLRFHDLRHEALSRWAHKLKGDVFKLSLISGHRTLQMAQRYVHPVMSELLHQATATEN